MPLDVQQHITWESWLRYAAVVLGHLPVIVRLGWDWKGYCFQPFPEKLEHPSSIIPEAIARE